MRSDSHELGIARSFFMGQIADHLLFPFPEMSADDRETVSQVLDAFNAFADREIDAAVFDRRSELPDRVRKGVAEMGLLGLTIPEEHGGFGFRTSMYCRVMEEISSRDGATAVFFAGHQSIGLKALLLFGTDEQKARFLPRLATGDLIAAYCLTEPGAGSDAAAIRTRAIPTDDGQAFLLSGQKQFVTNGEYASFATVFAKTPVETANGAQEKITAFAVTRDMPGYSVGKEESKLGIRGSSTTELHFDNVRVPRENVIGELGRGFKVAMEVLNTGRLSLGAGCVGSSKTLIRQATEYALERKQFGRPIIEFEMIREKLATMSADTYAVESMVYLTSGLADRGYQDFSVESAMCKLFSSEALWRVADEALQIAGGYGFITDYPYERMLRDARINRIFEGTNEIQKLYIALSGFREPGERLKEVGRALRNPIESVGTLGSYAAGKIRRTVSVPGMNGVASELSPSARHVQALTGTLAELTESVLRKHRKSIVEREYVLDRVAEAATLLYAMAASISRATARIEAHGVEKARADITLCRLFCSYTWRKARRLLREAEAGGFSRYDDAADLVREAKGYPASRLV